MEKVAREHGKSDIISGFLPFGIKISENTIIFGPKMTKTPFSPYKTAPLEMACWSAKNGGFWTQNGSKKRPKIGPFSIGNPYFLSPLEWPAGAQKIEGFRLQKDPILDRFWTLISIENRYFFDPLEWPAGAQKNGGFQLKLGGHLANWKGFKTALNPIQMGLLIEIRGFQLK